MRNIIVDGYNVIRADARLQSLEKISLEHARDVLVRTLASSPRLANDNIVVVFDGHHGTRSHIHAHRMGRLEVVYSARGQIADDVIVQQARTMAERGRVIVVSNDAHVRESCRAEGCEVSSSENLLGQLPGQSRPVQEVGHDDDRTPSLSTDKRGNPRRTSRRTRRQRDVRF